MIKTRRIVGLVIAMGLACGLSSVTYATLIAEIGINIPPAFEPAPPDEELLLYGFNAGAVGSIGVWEKEIGAGDVGQTFEAPIDIVQAVALGFTLANPGVNIRMHRISYSRPLDQLQESGWGIVDGRATFNKFVPDITKVPINRLTMTIDSFSFTRFGENASIGGGHTIRIYGVPEPAACGSIVICSFVLILQRREHH